MRSAIRTSDRGAPPAARNTAQSGKSSWRLKARHPERNFRSQPHRENQAQPRAQTVVIRRISVAFHLPQN
jgi:hypothetical protein